MITTLFQLVLIPLVRIILLQLLRVHIYIQDAQLEAGLVATDYIETTSSTAQAGILEDMPRLDYSGGASCPALLLEPQRTNVLPYSEYFNGWTQLNTISADNSATSPEGVQNAAKLVASSGYSNKVIYTNLELPSKHLHGLECLC